MEFNFVERLAFAALDHNLHVDLEDWIKWLEQLRTAVRACIWMDQVYNIHIAEIIAKEIDYATRKLAICPDIIEASTLYTNPMQPQDLTAIFIAAACRDHERFLAQASQPPPIKFEPSSISSTTGIFSASPQPPFLSQYMYSYSDEETDFTGRSSTSSPLFSDGGLYTECSSAVSSYKSCMAHDVHIQSYSAFVFTTPRVPVLCSQLNRAEVPRVATTTSPVATGFITHVGDSTTTHSVLEKQNGVCTVLRNNWVTFGFKMVDIKT